MSYPFSKRFSRGDATATIPAEFLEFLRQFVNTVKGTGITITKTNTGRDWTLAVNVDDATIELSGGVLTIKSVGTAQIAADAVDKTKIASDVAGAGLSQAAGGELDVGVDNATLQISGGNLRVKALGVGTSQIAANAVTSAKTTGATAGPLTFITSITVANGIVTAISGS